MPSGEMVTHGSEAREKSPPVQRVNGAERCVQVRPPSTDTPVMFPRAPPFDQRSCCQTPIRRFGLVGSTATIGSTSALA